mgnify:FL=1|jgi:hypothetical protein|tara:strand:- start:1904 stop:2188 length:285 start_codon:yes stop_codon:yes gene_type:complete
MPIVCSKIEHITKHDMNMSKNFFIFLSISLLSILLLGCEGRTPEEFDNEFEIKFDECFERAKLRCENLSPEACEEKSKQRCESFLGTKDNPIIK